MIQVAFMLSFKLDDETSALPNGCMPLWHGSNTRESLSRLAAVEILPQRSRLLFFSKTSCIGQVEFSDPYAGSALHPSGPLAVDDRHDIRQALGTVLPALGDLDEAETPGLAHGVLSRAARGAGSGRDGVEEEPTRSAGAHLVREKLENRKSFRAFPAGMSKISYWSSEIFTRQ